MDFRIEEAPYCPFSPSQGELYSLRRHVELPTRTAGRMRGSDLSETKSQTPHPSPLPSKGRGDNQGGDAQHRADYLKSNAEEALQTIEAEALRRRKKLKQPQLSLTILEPGLWSEIPELSWAMELRVIVKQGNDFSLLSPDEPKARKAFGKAHPDHVAAKKRLIDKAAKENLFAAEEDEEDEEEGADDVEGEVDTDSDDN